MWIVGKNGIAGGIAGADTHGASVAGDMSRTNLKEWDVK